ncbi:MAG: undecaprenyl diphosphate synthase family protein [Candidatus Aenigmarchaeota archaeon]|nr:undecaprenyl diphosphate synthase family protein [Candidatus Aenigmarchaeota archaeon]
MANVLYVPDGNRRFARDRLVPFSDAYLLGGQTLREAAKAFLTCGNADTLVYHATSAGTYDRTGITPKVIEGAATRVFRDLLEENFFERNGIRFLLADNGNNLPSGLLEAARDLEYSSKDGRKTVIVLAGYSFTSGKEIVVGDKVLKPDEFDLVVYHGYGEDSVVQDNGSTLVTLSKLNPQVTLEDLRKISRYLQ